MKLRLKPRRKRTYLYIAVALIILFYPLAIFIRADFVPFYANTFYRGSINQVFAKSFSSLNEQLNGLGFNTSQRHSTCYNGISDGGNAWYHGVSETVLCTTTVNSNQFVPSNTFKRNWKQTTPPIISVLKNTGWGSAANNYPNVTLENIYDAYDPQGYEKSVNYSKQEGNISCQLSIGYANSSGQPATNSNTTAYISETCQRYVSFFGGSQG